MADQELGQPSNEEVRPKLPPGVKLLRTLEGHQGMVLSVAFAPQGEMLASKLTAAYLPELHCIVTTSGCVMDCARGRRRIGALA